MNQYKKGDFPSILICDCNSTEHQIVIDIDEEEKRVYCHIHLTNKGFWRRLKSGLKYIFGYKSRFGHWDEFILKPEHSQNLEKILRILSEKTANI